MPSGVYTRTIECKKNMSLKKRKAIKWIVNNNGCYICISHKPNKNGYPHMRRNGKRQKIAHYLYEQKYGVIPKNMCGCHKCDNRLCINPEHLFLGTHQDNMRDKINKGRQRKGTNVNTAKLTENDVLTIFHSKEKTMILTKKYDITRNSIYKIRKGINWKSIIPLSNKKER